MKYVLILLAAAFAVPVIGQDAKSSGLENPLTSNWSEMGRPVDGPRGFTLRGRGMRINPHGQYELWIKVVPANVATFVKQYDLPKGTAYILQYATVDCSKRLLLLEKTAAFDPSDKPVSGRVSGVVPGSMKGSVKPGSIGEAVFTGVCQDPSLLPKGEQ
jgi:hypothetical protein